MHRNKTTHCTKTPFIAVVAASSNTTSNNNIVWDEHPHANDIPLLVSRVHRLIKKYKQIGTPELKDNILAIIRDPNETFFFEEK